MHPSSRIRRSRRRLFRSAIRTAAVMGALGSSFIVWSASDAAFSGTTTNAGNSVTAGVVSVSDDDAGTALFNVTGAVPGSPQTRCINVTYTGSTTSDPWVPLR